MPRAKASKKAIPKPAKRSRGVVRNELHCHECDKYVQFDIDLDLDGNHVLACPNCGHEHCRVVRNGEITSERWDSRNGNIPISASSLTYTTLSVSASTSSDYSTGVYFSDLWLQTVTTY